MSESKLKKFLRGSVTVLTVIIIAAVDTILAIFNTPIPYILIVSLIIALAIALVHFDERIAKIEKQFESIKNKLNRLNRRGVSQLIAVIVFILLILLLIAIITGTPNIATRILRMNITGTP